MSSSSSSGASDRSLPEGGDAPAPRVAVRDIARALNISHASVSVALRDCVGVSEELRARIKKTAAEMGYRPDPALVALSKYRKTRVGNSIKAALAWITMWKDPRRMHALREMDDYWLGAKKVAEEHGYHLYEFSPDARNSLDAVQRVLIARNIEGVLLSPPERVLESDYPAMDWSRFSVVRLGHGLSDFKFHLVTSAQAMNTIQAVRKMREAGYRRIGFVTSLFSNDRAQFLHGFLRACEEMPLEERIPRLALPELKSAEDMEMLADWLKAHRPDAVFSNLAHMRGFLGTLGYRVPEDIGLAVTSVHDCDASSGIDQCPFEIGRAACEMLISLLVNRHRGEPRHPRELLVEGTWVDGDTLPRRVCGQAPGSKK